MAAANSQSAAASLTAVTFTFPIYADTLTIENNDVQAAGAGVAYARTDGTAAVADAAGTISIAPGATVVLENLGAAGLPNANGKGGAAVYYCGAEKTFSQSEAVNWTVQMAQVGTGLTQVSMIGTGTPSGEWTVTAE